MNAIKTILVVTLASLGGTCSANEPVEKLARIGSALVVEGNNQFSLALYGKLRQTDGNLFFSPYSISTALAMTYAGAEGRTARQMAETLGFPTSAGVLEEIEAEGEPMTPEEFAQAFGEIVRGLNAQGQAGSFELEVANALWGQAGYPFRPEFIQRVESHYGGKLQEMDFVRAAEQARQTINGWVAQETNEKIKDLLGRGTVGPMTRLVLTNAIYFKGRWAAPFEERQTRPEPFALLDGGTVQAPMMNQKAEFRYAQVGANHDSPLQVLELPYVDQGLSMIILLPKATDGIEGLEARLNRETLTAWLDPLRRCEVKVTIPKFKLTSKFDLRKVLTGMGMTDAFSEAADFSGMTERRELFLSAVVHQAYVDVNEEGTEAAAATGAVISLTSMRVDETPVFRADHPFIFLIRDNASGSILFLGRVMNPLSGA